MSEFAVGTPPRSSVRNKGVNGINSNRRTRNLSKENTVNYNDDFDGPRFRASSSFDEVIKQRQDQIYPSTPERSGSKQGLSERPQNRTLRRSHSVMAYSPTRRVSSAKDDNTKVSERSRTYASMEEMFVDKKRPLQDIKNTQHVNVSDANKCNDKCTDNEDVVFYGRKLQQYLRLCC